MEKLTGNMRKAAGANTSPGISRMTAGHRVTYSDRRRPACQAKKSADADAGAVKSSPPEKANPNRTQANPSEPKPYPTEPKPQRSEPTFPARSAPKIPWYNTDGDKERL
jgi:hypothetical protein